MITANCNLCNQPYQIDESAAGMQIQCPSCGQTIVAASAAPPPPAPPVPAGAPGTGNPGVVWASQGARQDFKPGYKGWQAWVITSAAGIIITLLIYGVLAWVSMSFKQLPAWLVAYLPMVVGFAGASTIFSNEGLKQCQGRIPTLFMTLGMALALVTSAVPGLLTEVISKGKIRKHVVNTVVQETSAPHFAIGGKAVSLLAVKLGSPDKGICPVDAIYSDGRIYKLSVKRNVSKVLSLTGINEMKAQMIMNNHLQTLTASLQKYQALKNAAVKSIRVTAQPKPGLHHVTAALAAGYDLDLRVHTANQTLKFSLAPDSRRVVTAIPKVNRIWKEFDASGTDACSKIVLTKQADDTHWEATAHFKSKKEMPIFIRETVADNMTVIKVFFPAKESAILKINKIIASESSFGGREISEQCVNLRKVSDIRMNEEKMQAIFVEASPLDVVITKNGYDISIIPGSWIVHKSDMNKPINTCWSMYVPEGFSQSADSNDSSIIVARSNVGKKKITLNSKAVSALSKFDLAGYVKKERDAWIAKYPKAQTAAITDLVTTSGIKGYTYTASNGPVFRAKYFLFKDNNLTIMTFDDLESDGTSLDASLVMAKTLRYKDVAFE